MTNEKRLVIGHPFIECDSASLDTDAGVAMSKGLPLTIHIDGAARGNPGPAAFAYVIYHDGEELLDGGGVIGTTTNNVAEYTALIEALKKAAELKATEVLIRSDSELLVKQMTGQYRVKNANLLPLHREASRLARPFGSVRYSHVPREENRRADRLCNEALDGRPSAAGRRRSAEPPPPIDHPSPATERRHVLAEAERILRDAAHAWAEHGLDHPTPHQVLQHIVKLFEERGLIKA